MSEIVRLKTPKEVTYHGNLKLSFPMVEGATEYRLSVDVGNVTVFSSKDVLEGLEEKDGRIFISLTQCKASAYLLKHGNVKAITAGMYLAQIRALGKNRESELGYYKFALNAEEAYDLRQALAKRDPILKSPEEQSRPPAIPPKKPADKVPSYWDTPIDARIKRQLLRLEAGLKSFVVRVSSIVKRKEKTKNGSSNKVPTGGKKTVRKRSLKKRWVNARFGKLLKPIAILVVLISAFWWFPPLCKEVGSLWRKGYHEASKGAAMLIPAQTNAAPSVTNAAATATNSAPTVINTATATAAPVPTSSINIVLGSGSIGSAIATATTTITTTPVQPAPQTIVIVVTNAPPTINNLDQESDDSGWLKEKTQEHSLSDFDWQTTPEGNKVVDVDVEPGQDVQYSIPDPENWAPVLYFRPIGTHHFGNRDMLDVIVNGRLQGRNDDGRVPDEIPRTYRLRNRWDQPEHMRFTLVPRNRYH